jgi:photosystem II stability/assembly factor-like uncharacterized protein
MSNEPRRPAPTDDDGDDLPPLAGDEEAGDLDEPVERLIDAQRDDGMSWLDDRVGIDDYDDETIAREIGALEPAQEQKWTSDTDAEDELEGTETVLDQTDEYGWTAESDGPEADEWDSGLEPTTEDAPTILDDAGEEGVDEGDLDIDVTRWAGLDTVDGDGADDGGDDTIPGGMSYEHELRMDGGLLPPALDEAALKGAWLGPPGAPAVAVAFQGGTLFAAGNGLLEATRDALVPTSASPVVEEAQATTLDVAPTDPHVLVLGTLFGGLLVSTDGGRTIEPRNGWTTVVEGCGTSEQPTVRVRAALTTSSAHGAGSATSTLWLLTDRGHVLRSRDRGETWTRIAPEVEALALAAEPKGDCVAVLVLEEGRPVVLWGPDGETLVRRPLPIPAEDAIDLRASSLAVRGGEVLLGSETLASGIYYSPAPGLDWALIDACPRATCLAFVGQRPGTFLAGLFFSGRDLGTLLRTSDGGKSWVRVCDVGRLRDLFALDQLGAEDVTCRIHQIAVSTRGPRHVAIATGNGVFVLEMKDL